MSSDAGLVVVAAGSAHRFGRLKQLAELDGVPLLERTLTAFDQVDEICERVVVLSRELAESAEWDAIAGRLKHTPHVVHGGQTRAESVRNGVQALQIRCEFVAVHDGARPFPPLAATQQCLQFLGRKEDYAGAIVCSFSHDTLKELSEDGHTITRTIDRRKVLRAETPQVCRREKLLAAFDAPGADDCTDEAQVLENAGMKTAGILHDGLNLKVTLLQDLAVAEAYLKREQK